MNLARILSAGLESFAVKGYGNTNFGELAQELGCTRPAIYSYFKNKNALYVAVLETIQQDYKTNIEAIVEDDKHSYKHKLEKVLELFILNIDERVNFLKSNFLAAVPLELNRNPELIELVDLEESVLGLLQQFFQLGIDCGAFEEKVSADDLLIGFVGSLLGMRMLQQSTGIGSVEKSYDYLFKFIFDGLKTSE